MQALAETLLAPKSEFQGVRAPGGNSSCYLSLVLHPLKEHPSPHYHSMMLASVILEGTRAGKVSPAKFLMKAFSSGL